jgi:hypothetical protein
MIDNGRVWNSQVKAVEDSVVENTYSLVFNGVLITTAVFWAGYTFTINNHSAKVMLEACEPGTIFQLVDVRGLSHDVLFGKCSVVRFEEIDFATITLYKSKLGPRSDIVKKHITAAQLEQLQTVPNFDAILVYFTKDPDGTRKVYHIPVTVNTKFLKLNGESKPMLVYDVEGHKSACMSALIVNDDRFKDIVGIVGYHAAGNAKSGDCVGAAIAVTRELIVEMLSVEAPYVDVPTVISVEMRHNSMIPDHIPIIDEKPPLTQALYGKIVKTPFHGFMCDETGEPVKYNKVPSISMPYSIDVGEETVTHFPLYNILETFNNPTPAINDTIADMARAMYTLTWDRAQLKPEVPCIYSNNDVINGRDLIGPDSRKSSVGQALRYEGITKKMMYGDEGVRDLERPVIKALLGKSDAAFEQLKATGVCPEWLFLGFIKSELVNPTKIDDGIFRFIFGVDWQEHILCKRLFGFILNLATKGSIRNGMLMGMNPYSTDPDVIGKILEVFKLLLDGDYKWFDKRFYRWLFMQFALFCRHVYYNATEEEHRAREAILMRLASPRVLVIVRDENGEPVGLVIQLDGALSSGHTLTQLLGCFGNGLMIRYSYLMSWAKSIGTNHLSYDVRIHPKPNLAYEEDNIHTFVLGDDNIIAMCEERYGFNGLTIQDNMAEIGVVYTPSDKSARFTVPWRSLGEASILKRVVDYDEEECRYTMAIEESSILGALYYTECMKTFGQTIDTMLQEAALRGREYHKRLVFYLLKRAQEVEYIIVSPYLDYAVAKSFVLNTAYLPWGDASTGIFLEDDSSL